MKLKDIIPGRFYLTKPSRYDPTVVVKVLAIVDEPVYCAWRRTSDGRTTKKVKVANLHMEGDDTLVEKTAYQSMVPNRLLGGIVEEHAMDRLRASSAKTNQMNADMKLSEENHEAMIAALAAAGFEGASYDYRGITFGKAAIAAWAKTEQS